MRNRWVYALKERAHSGGELEAKQRTRFHQNVLIKEIGELAKQTNAKHRSTPFPSSWVPFTEADTVRDPGARKELDLYPFRKLLGKVAYVVRGTRSECLYHTAFLQQFQTCYGWKMVDALLNLIAYLVMNQDIMFTFLSGYDGVFALFAMCDASNANCPDTRLSHDGSTSFLFGCLIKAYSKNQKAVALSSMESEFMGAFEAAKVLIHLLRAGVGYKLKIRTPLPVLEDNNAAIMLSMKPSLNSSRARHMEVRWHWLQQQHLA